MSSPPLSRYLSDTYVVLLMAFVGGFVDASCYLKLEGLFTSSITGNLVVACASVSSTEGIICRSLVAVAFVLSAFVSMSILQLQKIKFKMSQCVMLLTAYSLELFSLIATAACGLVFNDIIDTSHIDDWPIVLTGCLAAMAMGVIKTIVLLKNIKIKM